MNEGAISERALNRALLARQGLLERRPGPAGEVVRAVGALQMQHWPALVPALWSRIDELPDGEPYRAHEAGELLTGTLLRGTIHTVTPEEYPAYAAVTAASNVVRHWRAEESTKAVLAELHRAVLEHAVEPRGAEELVEFVESWVARNPGRVTDAELEVQRSSKWRPLRSVPWLVRVPADGRWGARTPTAYRAAPMIDGPPTEAALATVLRCHLRAFGPAAPEDVAHWIAWNVTPVRDALRRMEDLVTLTDPAGRTLYDLPDAPRPDPATEAPVRLLPWFDSTLLAYAPKRRGRILPDRFRDVVYVKTNGQIKPTFLVDGQVAGMWTVTTDRATATLTLTPLRPLDAATGKAVIAEAERMVAVCRPDATTHLVQLDG